MSALSVPYLAILALSVFGIWFIPNLAKKKMAENRRGAPPTVDHLRFAVIALLSVLAAEALLVLLVHVSLGQIVPLVQQPRTGQIVIVATTALGWLAGIAASAALLKKP